MTQLTQLEFNKEDFKNAEQLALKLGYKQTVYTSTSALIGLFCLVDGEQYKQGKNKGCIIKTAELGFLFVQDWEDINGEVL